jgi:hypothetical protein
MIEEMTVRCSARNPRLVAVALDIATGKRPSLSWAIAADRSVFLALSTSIGAQVILRFPDGPSDSFLRRLPDAGGFTLAVEGCIPAFVPVALRPDGALMAYLESRGWR